MKVFYKLLAYALVGATTNNFVWFALTFFAYLQTRSVVSTAFIGGFYLIATAGSGFWFGSLIDHYKKKYVMVASSLASLVFFSLGFLLFLSSPAEAFTSVTSPNLWLFAFLLMMGVVAGNIVGIALPTLVTHLIPPKQRDRANGMLGTVLGISFAITSLASGLVLGFLGMWWVMFFSVVFTLLALFVILLIKIPGKEIIHTGQNTHKSIDIKGTMKVILGIPGMVALIIFTTFNNLLGGVFMALMDAYGLSLMTVQQWGLLWGIVSFGFIIGGLFIARRGLGKNPLRTLLLANLAIWVTCLFFPIQASIPLLFIGSFIWMSLFPFIEATEQTIIQKVVPIERQGRVFGFSQSVEQAASPLSAFLIGPIAQFIFIPFMTTGAGVKFIGSWFGVGAGRGLALVFITAGLIGAIATVVAWRSKAYKLLSARYLKG